MEKNDMLLAVAVVVATAGDFSEPMPLGPAYMALQAKLHITMSEWIALTQTIEAVGWGHITSETLTLTTAGRAKAAELNARMTH